MISGSSYVDMVLLSFYKKKNLFMRKEKCIEIVEDKKSTQGENTSIIKILFRRAFQSLRRSPKRHSHKKPKKKNNSNTHNEYKKKILSQSRCGRNC